MRRRIVLIVILTALALIAGTMATIAAVPALCHMASASWYLPDRLPTLAVNSHVHFEPGADDYAHDVAALLPGAIARVEAVHGRPFAHPVTVGVYATPKAYAAANPLGSNVPVGVTFFGRVNLSPKLFRPQHQRLAAILTHELSHAHLQGWMGESAALNLPNWFKEGLAVMVSGGGGAESVSEEEARAAIQRGEQIAMDETGSLQSLGAIRFDRAPANPSWYPVVLAYRQAGMFVSYLRESDRPAFDRMMNAILDGRPFGDALFSGYHKDLHSLWHEFALSHAE